MIWPKNNLDLQNGPKLTVIFNVDLQNEGTIVDFQVKTNERQDLVLHIVIFKSSW